MAFEILIMRNKIRCVTGVISNAAEQKKSPAGFLTQGFLLFLLPRLLEQRIDPLHISPNNLLSINENVGVPSTPRDGQLHMFGSKSLYLLAVLRCRCGDRFTLHHLVVASHSL